AVGKRIENLTQRDVVLEQAPRIDVHMVLLRRPAEGRHVNDPADLLELALELPVLVRLQVTQGQLRRTRQLLTVDRGDGRPGRKSRLSADRSARSCRSGLSRAGS